MGDDMQSVRNEIIELIPSLRAFARSLTRNSVEADDLLQESLTKALARIHQFTPGTNLKAWLMKIERNTFYTAYNRKKLEPVAPVEDFPSISTEPTQEWALRLRAVHEALQQIPAPQRDALILVGGAGLSYEEAADICGCAMGTIKSRVNRARNTLRDLTDSVGVDETPPIEQLHARSA